ncbi:MAG: ribonuclease P protein subunit [Candidatus Poseidoniaceae archaeon]|jgi:RNase P/RNase MRP subunit p29|nr:ribonuclease P protein subunit [Candidatus Poseidoniaceae archaeon]
MSSTFNESWIGRKMVVTSSNDEGLVGRKGIIIDESRETITLLEDNTEVILGKASIEFNIVGSESNIVGALVRQRAEDRINRNYRSE